MLRRLQLQLYFLAEIILTQVQATKYLVVEMEAKHTTDCSLMGLKMLVRHLKQTVKLNLQIYFCPRKLKAPRKLPKP